MPDSPHLYRQGFRTRGIPPSVADAAAAWTRRASTAGAEPVLSLGHLAHMTGAEYGYLRRVVARREHPYDDIVRTRANGSSHRHISSPRPVLMQVQRWLLRNAVERIPPSDDSFAYQRGKSVAACARRHLGATWLVKVDLHDFFHGISERDIYPVFSEMGYSPLVSFELARTVTRYPTHPAHPRRHTGRSDGGVIAPYSAEFLGFLPQGGPASGALANLHMRGFDMSIRRLCDPDGITYTRYSDDLVLSGAGPFSRPDSERLLRRVATAAKKHGLAVHERKTRIVPPGARKVVLGTVLTPEGLRLPRETQSRIDAHVRGASRFGVSDHAAHQGFASVFGFANHVDGLLSHAQDIAPGWTRRRWDAWAKAKTREGLVATDYRPPSPPTTGNRLELF